MARLTISDAEEPVPTEASPPTPLSIVLSPQQEDIVDFATSGDGSAIVIAVAGAGKTTILVILCKYLQGSTAYLAFNKKISDEIGFRLSKEGVGRNVKSATFHSFGLQAWKSVAPQALVDKDKVEGICEDLNVPRGLRSFVRQLVSLAKQRGIGIPGIGNDWSDWQDLVDHFDLEDKVYADEFTTAFDLDKQVKSGILWSQKVLTESNAQCTEIIDFDDMIYAPLCFQAPFPQFNNVLVDEAQDTNQVRRLMARAMLAPEGRVIAVGDPRQAIYGFTGADSGAMQYIKDEFDCIDLPLTVTYRCPKAVVRHARRWVSHITAHESAPEGLVKTIGLAEFEALTPERTDAILCRVTKPLIVLAHQFIRRKVACHVEGRDIGQSLITLTRKFRSPDIGYLRSRLEQYLNDERGRFVAQGKGYKAAALEDKIESIYAFMDSIEDDDAPVMTLQQHISALFQDSDGRPSSNITLSTVHKAKGREWDRVYLYLRDVHMPSRFATQQWQLEQEHNLIYVAVTRAKRELIEVMLGQSVEGGPAKQNEFPF